MYYLRFFLFIFLIISDKAISQEIDAAYLESLPQDIKEDVLRKTSKDNQSEDKTYRSNQFSSKLQKEEDFEDLKNRLEKGLQKLEERLNRDDKVSNDELKLFGSDFFDTIQTSFMPIGEANSDSSYILDFGDLIEIQLVGPKSSLDSFLIERDGSINIPNVGKLSLAGLSLKEASEIIKSKIYNLYVGTNAFITLKNIRDVNVLVAGNALNPGVYTLNGNSNMFHALSAAGGINEFGSYRVINLIRDSEIVETLDVYDLLINGKFNLNKRLRSGDIIFVEDKKNIVSVDGAVKRKAKYELLENENLYKAIEYSNGLSIDADLKNIFLDRLFDGNVQSLPISTINQFKDIACQDTDKIYIRKHPYIEATIEGAVVKPGTYILSDGSSLKELIDMAGGFTDTAYIRGATYETVESLEINKLAKSVLYDQFIDNIITISQQNPSSDTSSNSIVGLTQELNKTKANGRVVVDLLDENKSSKVFLRNNDKLTIPHKTNHVYVYGETSSEGSVMYSPQEDVDYYISKSGGFKDIADKGAIYVLHPNGITEKYSKNRNLFLNEPNEVILYPGSIIFVPRKLDDSVGKRLSAQAYVTILGNIGVALASLCAIDNN